jgi:hypothetical protein
MAIGLGRRRRRAVSLEEAAAPGAARCPACGEPLFVWIETEGWGPREDQLIDRCENCGLVVAREAVPAAEQALAALRTSRGLRAANAASLQAWLGAENWAALRPGDRAPKLTPRAATLLLDRAGLAAGPIRQPAAPAIASMWQTLLNLLTFHRDFAAEAASGRLRPGTGRGRAAFFLDAAITILAAIPTALLAVVLEGGALLVRRGGLIEVEALGASNGV